MSSSNSTSSTPRGRPPQGPGGSAGGVHSFVYSLEDTSERCYRDISDALDTRGWRAVPHRKRNKLEKKRFPYQERPTLIWTLNEKDIDFEDLQEHQICNHFEGITQLTTKLGFCDILREAKWVNCDGNFIAPRCFNLGDPIQRDEFIEDFRISSAALILKHILHSFSMEIEKSGHSGGSCYDLLLSDSFVLMLLDPIVSTCIKALVRINRIKLYKEWPEVERDFPNDDALVSGLSEGQWLKVLDYSYSIVESRSNSLALDWDKIEKQVLVALKSNLKISVSAGFSASNLSASIKSISSSASSSVKITAPTGKMIYSRINKIYQVLISYRRHHHHQSLIDGLSNIWIVKPPEAARGIGMKVLYKLADLLQCEKGMGSRIVQKYIENPLLAPIYRLKDTPVNTATNASNSNSNSNNKSKDNDCVKFDIRVWVIVSSFDPLCVWIYREVYGRRCVNKYDLSVKQLGDDMKHLTNYSVNRKGAPVSSSVSDSINGSIIGSSLDSSSNIDAQASTSFPSQSGLNAVRQLRSIPGSHGSNDIINSNSNSNPDSKSMSSTNLPVPEENCLNPNYLYDKIVKSSDGQIARVMPAASSVEVNPPVFPPSIGTPNSSSNRPKSANRSTRVASSASSTAANTGLPLTQYDLLLSHADIVEIIERGVLRGGDSSNSDSNSSDNSSSGSKWDTIVWPSICKKIMSSLMIAQTEITHRDKSFEFLGYDVMIDTTGESWVLEVNMSPAMSHKQDNRLAHIASMSEGLVTIGIDSIIYSSMAQFQNVQNCDSSDHAKVRECLVCSKDRMLGPVGLWELLYNGCNCLMYKQNRNRGRLSSEFSVSNAISLSSKASGSHNLSRVGANDLLLVGAKNNHAESFQIVGKAVSLSSIETFDKFHLKYEKAVYITKWAKYYYNRFHNYIIRREKCRLILQKNMRMFICTRRRMHMLAHIGKCLQAADLRRRKLMAKVTAAKRLRACIRIQVQVRILLAKCKVVRVIKRKAVRRIKLWINRLKKKWYYKKVRNFLFYFNLWAKRLKKYRSKVKNCICLHYYKRRRITVLLQRSVRRWLLRLRFIKAKWIIKMTPISKHAAVIANDRSAKQSALESFLDRLIIDEVRLVAEITHTNEKIESEVSKQMKEREEKRKANKLPEWFHQLSDFYNNNLVNRTANDTSGLKQLKSDIKINYSIPNASSAILSDPSLAVDNNVDKNASVIISGIGSNLDKLDLNVNIAPARPASEKEIKDLFGFVDRYSTAEIVTNTTNNNSNNTVKSKNKVIFGTSIERENRAIGEENKDIDKEKESNKDKNSIGPTYRSTNKYQSRTPSEEFRQDKDIKVEGNVDAYRGEEKSKPSSKIVHGNSSSKPSTSFAPPPPSVMRPTSASSSRVNSMSTTRSSKNLNANNKQQSQQSLNKPTHKPSRKARSSFTAYDCYNESIPIEMSLAAFNDGINSYLSRQDSDISNGKAQPFKRTLQSERFDYEDDLKFSSRTYDAEEEDDYINNKNNYSNNKDNDDYREHNNGIYDGNGVINSVRSVGSHRSDSLDNTSTRDAGGYGALDLYNTAVAPRFPLNANALPVHNRPSTIINQSKTSEPLTTFSYGDRGIDLKYGNPDSHFPQLEVRIQDETQRQIDGYQLDYNRNHRATDNYSSNNLISSGGIGIGIGNSSNRPPRRPSSAGSTANSRSNIRRGLYTSNINSSGVNNQNDDSFIYSYNETDLIVDIKIPTNQEYLLCQPRPKKQSSKHTQHRKWEDNTGTRGMDPYGFM